MRCVSVKIELGRTIQPAQYESKTARAEITYVPSENETEINVGDALTTAFDFAQAHICERLGLVAPGVAALTRAIDVQTEIDGDPPVGMPVDPAVAKKEATTAKRKATIAKNKAIEVERKAAEDADQTSAAAVTDDDEIPGFMKRGETATGELETEAKPKSAAAIEDDDDQPEVITDGELISAVSAKVAAMVEAGTGNAAAIIKKTIGAFNPEPGTPFKIPDIPQEKRKEFLATIDLIG